MGQSISPIAYRVGFSRMWNSLYTEEIYIKNYNYFLKTQIICTYIEGFFRKWMWNKRRSYFVGYIFSHLELSWSASRIQLFVYVYNSSTEYLYFKMLKLLKKKKLKISREKNFFFFRALNNFHKKNSSLSYFSRKKNNQSLKLKLRNPFVLDTFIRKLNFSVMKLGIFYDSLKKDRKSKRFKNLISRRIADMVSSKKKSFFIFKKHMRQLVRTRKRLFGKFGFVERFGIDFYKLHKHVKDIFSENRYQNSIIFKKKRQEKSLLRVYQFLLSLIKFRFYKLFFLYSNYFFSLKPLQDALVRYFLKDFYFFLGFNKLKKIENKFNLKLIRLSPPAVTSSILTRHVWLKLVKRYHFGKVIFGIIKTLRKNKKIKGFLIRCNGRFTKKQKAWHKVYRGGSIALSQQNAWVDDSFIFVKMKYGVGSIHININYT